jgi:hypothetical protein
MKLLEVLKMENTSLFTVGKVELSKTERIILGLGLKFIPRVRRPTEAIKSSLVTSLDRFIRSLRLAIYFRGSVMKHSLIPRPFIYKSTFEFTTDLDEYISTYKSKCMSKISTYNWNNNLPLLDQVITHTIRQLSRSTTLVYKPADKNLGTVVLNKINYMDICYNILNTTTYKRIISYDTTCTLEYSILQKIFDHYDKQYIIKRDSSGNRIKSNTDLYTCCFQLYNTEHLRIPTFYILPKMHKPWKENLPQGRPIVSSINSCTYFTSKYLHNYLTQLVSKLPTICRSSLEIITIAEVLHIPSNYVIVCADVRSLYPSIPVAYGMNAVKTLLYAFNLLDVDFHLQLLYWVLANNKFSFNNEIFHQLEGTAMGTPLAVEYANIVLYYLESKLLDSLQPLLYRRYIDDLFIIIEESNAPTIEQMFNEQCSSIQLDDVTIGLSGIFLDLNITITNNKLITNLYQKELNKYLYLPPTSSHKASVMKG